MRKLCIGDIHGGYRALLQCIERSNYDPENDLLISLGDIVDGYPESKEVIDYLMSLKNFILVLGNHDYWFWNWLKTGATPAIWTHQGGFATLKSFQDVKDLEPYRKFFNKSVYYYLDDDRIFVHGGFPLDAKIENISGDVITWDRDLLNYAFQANIKGKNKFTRYTEVFLGHTSTTFYKVDIPLQLGNIWALDQGGGWEGKLSIIDIDTKQWWQSDKVSTLYPECKGRG